MGPSQSKSEGGSTQNKVELGQLGRESLLDAASRCQSLPVAASYQPLLVASRCQSPRTPSQ